MKKYIIVFCVNLLAFVSIAQRENTLYFMPSLYQATHVNPVALPEHKVSIGLPIPSTYFHLTHTGFTYADLVDGNQFNYNNLPNVLKNSNLFSIGAAVDLFSLRIKVKKNYFSFNLTERVNFDFSYPKDLLNLPIKGNAAFEGSTIDLSGLKINMSQYREYGIGYTRDGRKWEFGGRVKLLYGKANISTRNSDITIDVAEGTLAHVANAELQVNYAGPVSLPTDFSDDNQEIGELDQSSLIFNSQNFGIAFDAGAGYKFSDRLHFSAALLNLGFITWKQNARNYRFKGDAAFAGVDVLPAFLEGTEPDSDSLTNEIIGDLIAEGTEDSYSTRLTYQINLSAQYRLLKSTHVHGLYNISHFKRLRGALTLGITQDIRRAFSLSLTNTTEYGKLINIGVGLMVKPGPFQFYVVGDNFNVLLSPITPTSLDEKTFAIRIGMNLVFGRILGEDKLQTVIE